MVDFGHPMRRADSLEKTLMLGKIEGRREENDRGWDGWMASLTHGLEFEQTPGDSEGQGNLVGCSSWSGKKSDTTERLNGNKYINRILCPFILLDARGAPGVPPVSPAVTCQRGDTPLLRPGHGGVQVGDRGPSPRAITFPHQGSSSLTPPRAWAPERETHPCSSAWLCQCGEQTLLMRKALSTVTSR